MRRRLPYHPDHAWRQSAVNTIEAERCGVSLTKLRSSTPPPINDTIASATSAATSARCVRRTLSVPVVRPGGRTQHGPGSHAGPARRGQPGEQ